MSIIGIDPQIAGVMEDGSESGVVRTKDTHVPLIPYPFKEYTFGQQIGASSSATYQSSAYFSNPDGSNSSIRVSLGAAAGAGLQIFYPFYGRAFGVRWSGDESNTMPGFTVTVDGTPVYVDSTYPQDLSINGFSATAIKVIEAQQITHENLDPNRLHLATLDFAGGAAGARAITIFGLLLDRDAGYVPVPRMLGYTTSTLTTSQAEVQRFRTALGTQRGIRSIIYTNTSESPVTVTIMIDSKKVWVKAIPAGDTEVFDPGGPIAGTALMTHAASAAASINATVMGVV